jgi:hypothetical protein
MDKDSVILKYMQEELTDADKDITSLHKINNRNEKSLNSLDAKMDEVYRLLNMKCKAVEPKNVAAVLKENDTEKTNLESVLTYEELFQEAQASLAARGLDVESMDYHSQVSQEELEEIIKELNRPLPRKEKWEKSDFIVLFFAGIIGCIADLILANRNNKLTGKNSSISKMLNKLHVHEVGDAIDYQESGMGGGLHRIYSPGHDLVRFIEAVIQIKEGRFEGFADLNKDVIRKVISTVNSKGNPFNNGQELSWIEAVLRYTKHMVGDVFSTHSLPFPGCSLLIEFRNRDMRKLAAVMYYKGFNIKNVALQSFSTICVEIIIRTYLSIKSFSGYKNSFQVDEDYSNLEAIKKFIKPDNEEKRNEMLLVAHAIVTAFNIGKIIVKKSIWEINITEIFSVIKYGIKVVNSAIYRNSQYAKLIRNSSEIHDKWQQLANEICIDDIETEFMTDTLVIE